MSASFVHLFGSGYFGVLAMSSFTTSQAIGALKLAQMDGLLMTFGLRWLPKTFIPSTITRTKGKYL